MTNDNHGLFAEQPAIAADGTLTYKPADNANGEAHVTVRLKDDGGIARGGADTSGDDTFTITVTAVNDAPVLSGVPATRSTLEDTDLTITGVAVADVDVAAGALKVDVAVAHGTVALGSTTGLTFTTGASGQATMQFSGTLASVNAALGTLTYRGELNYNGADTLSVTVSDQGNTGSGGTLTASGSTAITVTAVNDFPTFIGGGDQTVAEDAGSKSVAWATAISTGAANETAQTLTFDVTNDNHGLFAEQPAIAADGTLTYKPADNANGEAHVTVRLKDDGGIANGGADTSAANTFTITVTAVNDAPVLSGVPATRSTLEDTDLTITGVAVADVDVAAGALKVDVAVLHGTVALGSTAGLTFNSGGSGQATMQFTGTLANVNAALGALTYRGGTNYNGADTLSLTISDQGNTGSGGTLTASGATAITVTAVNDVPTFAGAGNRTVAEDAGSQSVAWATEISTGAANETAQTLSFDVTNDNHGLFAEQPAIAADGTLTYKPADNANGEAHVTVLLQDDGGTANGGADTTAAETFTITVTAVNDAPVLSGVPATRGTLEDTDLTITGVAVTDLDVAAGALKVDVAVAHGTVALGSTTGLTFTTGASGQATMQFTGTLASVNAALGTLTYRGGTNYNGADTLSLTIADQGNTGSGGTLTASGATAITVTAVNDVPTFAGAGNQTVTEDAGSQSVAWATEISTGAANETAQTLTFDVTNDNHGLFAGQPAIAADGTLTYKPADNANGEAHVTVRLLDDGGTTNGGADTSAANTFTIKVTAVNDAPVLSGVPATRSTLEDTDLTVSGIAVTDLDVAAGTLKVDVAVAHGTVALGSTTGLTFTTGANGQATMQFTGTLANVNAALATLTYRGEANYNGADTLSVTVSDQGNTGSGGTLTASGSTAITVTDVNDVPSFDKGANQTVAEDAGPQSLPWATAISTGAANETAQTLTFDVTNDNHGLFAEQPAIAADGTLTYKPADNANGEAHVTVRLQDDGGTANGGADISVAETFTIKVTAVNDAPVLSGVPATRSTLEDTDLSITGVAVTDVDVAADALKVDVAVLHGTVTLGSTTGVTFTSGANGQAAMQFTGTLASVNGALGSLTYRGEANYNGSDTLSVTVSDQGNTGSGGALTASGSTAITVTAVNDAPSFEKGANQTVAEDAGQQSLLWATAISKGPLNEAAQTLTFDVTNDNTTLFAEHPTITADGTLTYTPADNANGEANVTVVLRDDGGTANGGADTAVTRTFTIQVTAVNDAPTFTGTTAVQQTIRETETLQPLTATDVEGEALSFSVLPNTLPEGITLLPNGTFTGVASYHSAGNYSVEVTVSDGHDSTSRTLEIRVGEWDTTPTLSAIADQDSREGQTVTVTVAGADLDGDTLTYSATGLPEGVSINPTTGTMSGTLTYTAMGTYPVTVTVTDSTPTAGTPTADRAQRTFVWKVEDVNRAPRYTGPATLQTAEGQGLSSGLSGVDEDGSRVTFALGGGSLPEGVQLASDGTFTGKTSYRSAGTYSATILVSDPFGGTGSGTLQITVTNTDTAPVLGAVPDRSDSEGDRVSLSLSAQDPDGDTLNFRAFGLPAGLSIDSATGVISGVIAKKTAGTYPVTVMVTDNTPVDGREHSVSQSFTWQVKPKKGPKPVKGQVTNAKTGQPVVGAAIQLQLNEGGGSAAATTGTDGGFESAELGEGAYTLTATARGFVSKTIALTIGPDELADLTLALEPIPAVISGIVTDAVSHEGLAGVKVTLTRSQGAQTATTAGDGTYRFAEVIGGQPVTISVSDADYVEPAAAEFVPQPGATETRNFALQPRTALTLSGPAETQKLRVPPTVTGNFMTGRSVSIIVNGAPAATVTTDATGAFQYDLSAVKANLLFGMNTVTAQVQTPTGRTRSSGAVRFNFSPAGAVTGRVTTQASAPLGGVEMRLVNTTGDDSYSASTAQDGTFGFEQVPPGVYNLTAGPGNRPLAQVQVAVVGGQQAERNLVINTQAALSLTASPAVIVGDGRAASRIEVRATLSTGQPLTGVTVQFSTSAGTLSAASAVTDGAGQATVTLTAPLLDQISLRREEVRAAISDSASGIAAESSVVISLVPATITGVVVENGKPVEGARVSVAEDFNNDGVIDFAASVLTGPDGKYVIEVPRGNWVYKANVELPVKPGSKEAPLTVTQTSSVGALAGVGESVAATRAIGGQVLLGNLGGGTGGGQTPAVLPPGFTVQAALRSPTGTDQGEIQVHKDGTYLVEGVAAGEYEIVVQVTAPSGERLAGAVAKATVSEGGSLVLSTILIDPYGIVTDTFTGQPVPGVKMRLMWADTQLNREKGRIVDSEVQLPLLENFPPANNADPQWTDAKGTYAWMVFPEGDYYLLAEKDGYLPYDSRREGRNVAARAGEDSYVQQGVIHVGQTIVNYDFRMTPTKGVHKKFVGGFPDGEFKPDRPLTRAEAAAVLERLAGTAGTVSLARFKDLPDTHWAAKPVAAVAALGLMRGDPDGNFRPDDQLTRAEIAVIIGRLKNLPGLPGTAFADTRGHWAEQAIAALQAAGIMQGLPDGTFQPERAVTRAEFVTVVNRALGRGSAAGPQVQVFPDVPLTHWAAAQITEAATDHSFEVQADGTERRTTP
ncbi:MAG TPA: tandem-95 repeat protein [Symbiobacteriaceae bacterium]|nr:tandem-95 repeat protein [Symbiobacteriaceae bacterium]